MEMEEFHKCVGEVLMYCQCIEHDIKFIYAYMADGGFKKNMIKMDEERWTLGMVVHALKEYDQSWEEPFFSESDYELLFGIVNKRNYYAHKVYLSFCYIDDDATFSKCFERECRQLEEDLRQFSDLYERIESSRIKYMSNDRDLTY